MASPATFGSYADALKYNLQNSEDSGGASALAGMSATPIDVDGGADRVGAAVAQTFPRAQSPDILAEEMRFSRLLGKAFQRIDRRGRERSAAERGFGGRGSPKS